MLEIKNKLHGPIQLVIRTKRVNRGFTCLNIPGRQTRMIEDELVTEYIERAKQAKFIEVKYISNADIIKLKKGDN